MTSGSPLSFLRRAVPAIAAPVLLPFLFFLFLAAARGDPLADLLRLLLAQASRDEVPFREVVRLATGRTVLPLDPEAAPDRAILDAVTAALAEAIDRLNQPGSPVRSETRINEVSLHFERALLEIIDRHPDFSCARPRTAAGESQAAGYPDLLIVHLPSGRAAYLDPKLLRAGSLDSSLRTFYYTPRGATNKVLHDAHHLLAGIEHDGRAGQWTFTGWKLVDLHGFRVRLKAEYQAGNRELYRQELILRSTGARP